MRKLQTIAEKKGIRYFLINFIDMYGVARAKLIPVAASDRQRIGFAGFSTWLDMTPDNPDTLAVPDPHTLTQLPWEPEVGWLACDLWLNGKPLAASPRIALKEQVRKMEQAGWRVRSAVECEYFLVTPDGKALADPRDDQDKPCYEQQALMRRYDFIREVLSGMEQLGWEPCQSDHEDANGQFEMNWRYADALITADRHAFFKFMVKAIAEKHGMRATFMPKPFVELTGSGCHAHVSLWDRAGKKNLFIDKKKKAGLAGIAGHFIGGIIHNAPALAALFNPTVNSYKRLNKQHTRSGVSWSSNAISHGHDNRTHMIRVPAADRFELRMIDSAANPYLLQAGLLAAGLDGLRCKRSPGKSRDSNMFDPEEQRSIHVPRLPDNLLDALRALDGSTVLRRGLGKPLIDAYIKLKREEWEDHCAHISDRERRVTLDC